VFRASFRIAKSWAWLVGAHAVLRVLDMVGLEHRVA